VDYKAERNWLCLPGRADVCSTPVATTALNPNGYGSTGRSVVNAAAPVDCFYVYPTVSRDPGLNSDLNAGSEERLMAETQFARFASVCRPFAPIYRQMTLASVAAYATGGDVTAAGALAYADVAAAWRNFIATRSSGRPFVLIGHSQGSLMLQLLIAREIETNPALLRRMRLAIIPGYNVLVPQGRLIGGTFKRTPLCSRPGQTGCVMSWVSFRERNSPPPGAIFGIASQPGMPRGPEQAAGSRSTATGSRARRCPSPAGRSSGRAKARRHRHISAPRGWSPAGASTRGRAAICRSAPMPTQATSAPTASAAKSGCSGCSCPAGACTSPTSQRLRVI
jgi:hypothetical protein